MCEFTCLCCPMNVPDGYLVIDLFSFVSTQIPAEKNLVPLVNSLQTNIRDNYSSPEGWGYFVKLTDFLIQISTNHQNSPLDTSHINLLTLTHHFAISRKLASIHHFIIHTSNR